MTTFGILYSDRALTVSALFCTFSVFVFGLWATMAPISEGIVAFGRITVEDTGVVVQHLEGGLVEQVYVKEGEAVRRGDPLVVLTNRVAESERNQAGLRLAMTEASLRRIEALLRGEAEADFEGGYLEGLSDADVFSIVSHQKALLEQQSEARSSSLEQLESRRYSFLVTTSKLLEEQALFEATLAQVQEELAVKRSLFEKRVVARQLVMDLEREEARLLSSIASIETRLAEAEAGEALARSDMRKTIADFEEAYGTEYLSLQQELSELRERMKAFQDRTDRSVIVSPSSGVVLNLAYEAEGGVVKAGETIMEIVPDNSNYFAFLEIKPSDRDAIHQDMQVEIRLAGFDSWQVEPLPGLVDVVSADLKKSASGQYSYYEARVRLVDVSSQLYGLDLRPGMPVEAFLTSGSKKTFAEYLFEPLRIVGRRGLKE